jgi:hypothetical protein
MHHQLRSASLLNRIGDFKFLLTAVPALVRIRIALSNVWPNTAPRMPTKITQTALIAGIPPILPPTAIAIGVVTDFGRIDAAISWWLEYHDNQLTSLINNALQNAPDMQVAEQCIQLAEAQAKAVATQDGPQIDFSADMERQKMSAEGLMGSFALNDPAAGTTGPWYTNGTFGLTAGWHLDIWGKNRVRKGARRLPCVAIYFLVSRGNTSVAIKRHIQKNIH